MAILSDTDRAALHREAMQDASNDRAVIGGITKADLRAAINAADTWVDGNSASFNTAIPQPARGALTAKQKARLLLYVVRRRYEVG